MSKDNGGPASDRELLELAAKAIGLTLRYNYLGGRDANQPWNPLDDDGDALRLAMELNMSLKTQAAYPGNYQGSFSVVATSGTVENSSYGVCVSYSSYECFVEEYVRDGEDLAEWQKEFDKRTSDKMIATRRAIVRAAAAIGSAM